MLQQRQATVGAAVEVLFHDMLPDEKPTWHDAFGSVCTKWKHAPFDDSDFDIRSDATRDNASKTGIFLKPNTTFLVIEERERFGVTFLRLADGRGWVFDHALDGRLCVPADGRPCTPRPQSVVSWVSASKSASQLPRLPIQLPVALPVVTAEYHASASMAPQARSTSDGSGNRSSSSSLPRVLRTGPLPRSVSANLLVPARQSSCFARAPVPARSPSPRLVVSPRSPSPVRLVAPQVSTQGFGTLQQAFSRVEPISGIPRISNPATTATGALHMGSPARQSSCFADPATSAKGALYSDPATPRKGALLVASPARQSSCFIVPSPRPSTPSAAPSPRA